MAASAKIAKTPAAARAAVKVASLPPEEDERRFLRRLQEGALVLWNPDLTLVERLSRRGWIVYKWPLWTLTEAGRAVLDKTSCWA